MSRDRLPPCTLYRLRMATRKATRAYDRHLARCGLGSPQYGLLMTIDAIPGNPVGVVAERLDMDRTTLTRNLKLLVERGFVSTEGQDRRTRALRLTKAGEAKLAEARTHWRQAQNELEAHNGEQPTLKLNVLLAGLIDKLPDD
ncbi:MAG: MarR family winged helix-turn-helix transcriptional regulator [Hyphomicrobiaceae bacterium]|nr:MarR family winged helix-turn-helix transcriptional regulator [Hyphomicrobiaceae bacterium]